MPGAEDGGGDRVPRRAAERPVVRDHEERLARADDEQPAGARVLTYVEQAQDVVGSWNVTGYLTHDASAFTSVLAGTTVTARFDTTGRVSGSSGCNNYGGPYTVTGSAISIGPLGGTLKGCTSPDGIQQQERDFQAALASAKTFTVTGTTLTLFDGQHRRAVTMTRAPTS